MIKCVIIDDEPLAQDVLEEHILKTSGLALVGKFNNALAAKSFLAHNEVDVLLLDIEMPEMTGINFLKSLSQAPLTVFTTAYRDYAFEGFELGVIDFLLKPISFQRFAASIEKIKDFLSLKAQGTVLEAGEREPEFIVVKSGLKRIKLYFNKVTHIQGLKDYAIIHTDEERIVIKGSIKMVQEMLPSALFVRVHKSFLVLKKQIMRIERNKIIVGSLHIPIGRNYREEVEKSINIK
jgi:DNA-binding LytR/AlgR family response regulator